jgi:hypothetical protein
LGIPHPPTPSPIREGEKVHQIIKASEEVTEGK